MSSKYQKRCASCIAQVRQMVKSMENNHGKISLLSHNFSEQRKLRIHRRIGSSCVSCLPARICGLNGQFHVSEEFLSKCEIHVLYMCHGSGLLAKGGCREFPFSRKSVPNQRYSHIFVGQQWGRTITLVLRGD